MNRTYEEWLKYYENVSKEQVIEDMLHDIEEIERLNKENEFLKLSNPEMNIEHFRVVKENDRKIDNLRQENNRLNNIINELEKYLNEQVDYMTHYSIERMVAFDCCRHKLQELKGSDK